MKFELSGKSRWLLERPLGIDAKGEEGKKKRTSLYLNEAKFKEFTAFCKARSTTASEVIDALIGDILVSFGNEHKKAPPG